MDPILQQKINEAKAAGYSDEEIQQYLQTQAQPGQAPQTTQSQQGLAPMNRSEEYGGLGQGIFGDAVKYLAEGYAGKKLIVDPLMNAIGSRMSAQPVAPTQITPQAIPQQMPQAVNGPSQLGGNEIRFPRPNVAPTTPAPVATPVQQPSMIQQGMEYANKVRQIAMDKVMQNAGAIRNVGVGAAAALTPGNVGQNYPVPMSGPYKGMEINPMTHRPWTPQELAQFNR